MSNSEMVRVDTNLEMEEVSSRGRGKRESEADEEPVLELSEASEPLTDEALRLSTQPIITLRETTSRGFTTLQTAEATLKQALQKYERATARSAYRTPESHAASAGEHRPALLAVAEEVTAQADVVYQQARNLQAATANDRELPLSSEQLTRANGMREFIKEDTGSLPLPQLRLKLSRAVADSDVSVLWLYLRYLPERLKERRPADVREEQTRTEIVALLRNVEDRLLDKRGRDVNTQATQLRAAALATQRNIRQMLEEGGHIQSRIQRADYF